MSPCPGYTVLVDPHRMGLIAGYIEIFRIKLEWMLNFNLSGLRFVGGFMFADSGNPPERYCIDAGGCIRLGVRFHRCRKTR